MERNIQLVTQVDSSPLDTGLVLTEAVDNPEFLGKKPDTPTNVPELIAEAQGVVTIDESHRQEDSAQTTPENDAGGGKDKEYTNTQMLALAFQEDGTFPADMDVDNMTSDTLKEELMKSMEVKASASAESKYSQRAATDPHYDYAEMLFNGAQDEELVYAKTLDQLAAADISDMSDDVDRNREHLIRQYYKSQNISEKNAEKLLTTVLEDGDDLEEAQAAQKHFARASSELKLERKRQGEELRVKEETQLKEYTTKVNATIDSGKLGDIDLPVEEQVAFKKALWDKTEKVEVNGKTEYVTLYQKKMSEIKGDPVKELQLAKLLIFDGLNTENIIQKAENNASKRFSAALDGKSLQVIPEEQDRQRPKRNSKITPLVSVDA